MVQLSETTQKASQGKVRYMLMCTSLYMCFMLIISEIFTWWNSCVVSIVLCMCRCITDPAYEDVNNAFERALVFLHKVSAVCTLLNHYRGENVLQDSLCTARKRTHLVQDFYKIFAIH